MSSVVLVLPLRSLRWGKGVVRDADADPAACLALVASFSSCRVVTIAWESMVKAGREFDQLLQPWVCRPLWPPCVVHLLIPFPRHRKAIRHQRSTLSPSPSSASSVSFPDTLRPRPPSHASWRSSPEARSGSSPSPSRTSSSFIQTWQNWSSPPSRAFASQPTRPERTTLVPTSTPPCVSSPCPFS